MSKILSIFLIIFISQFAPFISEVQAAEPCTSSKVKISYGNPDNGTTDQNTFFPENSGDLVFEFSINDTNTLNTLLQSKEEREVRLHFGTGPLAYNTDPAKITKSNSKFQLIVKQDQNQAKQGKYEGVLDWYVDSKNDFEEFCSQIKYEVGVGNKCTIDESNLQANGYKLPPKSNVTIKFIGNAKTDYQLAVNTGLSQDRLKSTTTGDDGMGIFEDVKIEKNIGDKFKLSVLSSAAGAGSCHSKEIEITATAPPPSKPSEGPIIPSEVTNKCDPKGRSYNAQKAAKECTSSGDKEKVLCGDDKNNPGIRTAIGCIHTSPVGFIKDFLKFIIGISGGLAFLMMILGAFQMLTSAGNPETLQAGRERLTSAIIGLLFVIFSVLLLQIIGVGILNIPGFS